MSGRFAGKSAVVTGAASGIGWATARLLAEEGAQVLAVDLDDKVEDVGKNLPAISTLCLDVGDEESVARMVATAIERNGVPDIIVANAGVSGGNSGMFDQGAGDWAEILRINLIGPFLAIKYGAQAMLDSGRAGTIVCTASVAGLRSGAGGVAYSASKAGVINLVQLAAQQLSGSGIRVNAVCPGLIETGMTRPIYEHVRAKGKGGSIGQLNPLRRGGEPVEIAEAIAFLASDASSYVNGQSLSVDGGLSTSLPFTRPASLGRSTT